MARIDSVRVNPELELNGVWIRWVYDIELLIARMGNPRYDEEVKRLSMERANKSNVRVNDFKDGELEEIVKEASSKCILLDWKNLDDDDDEPIEYSQDQALEFFRDETMRDLYKFVILNANSIENYRRNSIKDSAKNLDGSSDGNQNGDSTSDS